MIALIGSRTFTDEELVYSILDAMFPTVPDVDFISGGAIGVDTICKEWADMRGYECKVYKIKGNEHPFDRNTRVAKAATRIVAFVQRNKYRSGTWNTISQFLKMGKSDYIVFDEEGRTWYRW